MEHTTYRSKKGVCTMAVDFSKSKTRENLMRAFAGESQARNRYTIAAKQASRDNLYSISQIFYSLSDQERAHAEVFYELLRGQTEQTIEICGGYPVNLAENVTDLLKSAVHNEMQEFEDVYPKQMKHFHTYGGEHKTAGQYELLVGGNPTLYVRSHEFALPMPLTIKK